MEDLIMDATRYGPTCDNLAHLAATCAARRGVLRAAGAAILAGLGATLSRGTPETIARRRKRDEPKKKVCVCTESTCRTQKKPKTKVKKLVKRNPCAYRGRCTGANPCAKAATAPPQRDVSAPFSIEAVWTTAMNHDSYLFVPKETPDSNSSSFIAWDCYPANSNCDEDVYPFACGSPDVNPGPGAEVITVRKLLNGRYEYWVELDHPSPAEGVTVTLIDDGGSVVRSWSSPINLSLTLEIGWHVFDIDGATGQVTSVDETTNDTFPFGAPLPVADVCPL
jgi:hypothetical protein